MGITDRGVLVLVVQVARGGRRRDIIYYEAGREGRAWGKLLATGESGGRREA